MCHYYCYCFVDAICNMRRAIRLCPYDNIHSMYDVFLVPPFHTNSHLQLVYFALQLVDLIITVADRLLQAFGLRLQVDRSLALRANVVGLVALGLFALQSVLAELRGGANCESCILSMAWRMK